MEFAPLQKAESGHVDALATHSVAMATAEEVATEHRQMQKASNIFIQDFWAP